MKLHEISDIFLGYTKSGDKQPIKPSKKHGIIDALFLKLKNIDENGIIFENLETVSILDTGVNRSKLILEHDIIISLVGKNPKVNYADYTFEDFLPCNSFAIVRNRNESIFYTPYIFVVLKLQNIFSKQIEKNTKRHFSFSIEDVKNIDIPYCTLEEQHEIVEQYYVQENAIRKLKERIFKQI